MHERMTTKNPPLTAVERQVALAALRADDWEHPVLDKVRTLANNSARSKPNRARALLKVLHRLALRTRVSSPVLARVSIGWERHLRALRELGFAVEFTPVAGKDHGWYALKDGMVWTADVAVEINGRREVVPVTLMANSRTHAQKAAQFKAVRCSVIPETVRLVDGAAA